MSDETCPLCKRRPLDSADDRKMQACWWCASEIGIVPMPPARRPLRPCARCNHTQLMRVIPREHSTRPDSHTQVSAPMYLTHAPTASGLFNESANPIAIQRGFGMLEAYVCRKCGVVEWYCSDADRIPAHPHLMSELIDCEGEGPYR